MLMGAASAVASISGQARPAPSGNRKLKTPVPIIDRPDGTRLWLTDWGSGEPLLFVHAAGLDSSSWAYQLTPLMRAGYRCVAYDRRGHGRSSVPGAGYDYDTLSDDLAAVIEALDLRDLTLIGHSMGCGEIVRYLTRHGAARIRRIALLAPTLPFFLKTADNPLGLERSFFEGLRAAWLRDYPGWAWQQTPAFFTPGTSQALQQWGFTLGTQTSLHAILESNIAVTETDFRAELPRISVPTLILHGTEDKSCPLAMTGERTAKLIPGARLEVIDGAPHGLILTHAERVNAELLKWCQAGKVGITP
jgi:pimeloyl-ACP methyl ester carboxylesterase